jgi:hypothetical protein
VPDPRAYRTLEFMRTTFLNSLSDLARDDQRRVIRALEQLDADERILSLRVHQLKGSRAGLWSASASRTLRITFRDNGVQAVGERQPTGLGDVGRAAHRGPLPASSRVATPLL